MTPNEETEVKQRVKKGHPQKLWKRTQKTENRKKRREEKLDKFKEWRKLARTCEFHARRHWIKLLIGAFIFVLLIAMYNMADLDDQRTPPVTDKVIVEFAQNGTSLGTVTLGLFGQVCPKTSTNFIMLATHEKGYGYRGTQLFMVMRDHLIAGGDTENDDGTGGKSALKKPFLNENFGVSHTGPGYLGMVSIGSGHGISRRMSQFYITLGALRHMDGKSVIFGKVLKGMEVFNKIAETPVDKESRPLKKITIKNMDHTPN
ncbi:peptidyl-prolyl cis-trans isomerase 6-like [Styela clava]